MKYILMMNTMKAGHGVPSWPKKDLQAHIAFMMGSQQRVARTRRAGIGGRAVVPRPGEAGARGQGWPARHGRRLSGIQGVPRRLLDHRCRQSTTSI
jgi:hypothetical protein